MVLASFVLSQVALAEGYDVKQSEVHGMSQRGGSVTSHFRFGDKVWAPLVVRGLRRYPAGFRGARGSALRQLAQAWGLLIYNSLRINPSPVSAGLATYPEDIDVLIAKSCERARA